MISQETFRRYRNDIHYHYLVDSIVSVLYQTGMSIDSLISATSLAVHIYQQNKARQAREKLLGELLTYVHAIREAVDDLRAVLNTPAPAADKSKPQGVTAKISPPGKEVVVTFRPDQEPMWVIERDSPAPPAPTTGLPLAEIRDVLLDAGHPQAKWSAPRQWTGGFACKQTTLNEAEVAVYHVWASEYQQPAKGIGCETPHLLAYQGALIRAGYAVVLLSATPNPLLLVSRSAGETAWADPWRIDEVSGVKVG